MNWRETVQTKTQSLIESISNVGRMMLLGVDPGLKGGIAFIDTISGQYGAYPMPVTTRQKYTLLHDLKETYGNITAYCEQVQVMGRAFGAKAALSYGQGYGELIGILTALGASIHEVRPSVWKRKLNISADKESAILLCERLYPDVELVPKGCRRAQDGLAEAMLIAHYGRITG